MFIRSSTAINDCLIALDIIAAINKLKNLEIEIFFNNKYSVLGEPFLLAYKSQEARDKAFDELCAYLTSNYKLRDFT